MLRLNQHYALQNPTPENKHLLATAQTNFEFWKKLLHSGNPENIGKFYKEAHFFPTLLANWVFGEKQAKQYFERLMKEKARVQLLDSIVLAESKKNYTHSGAYVFFLNKNQTQNPQTLKATFWFKWEQKNGIWILKEHFSKPAQS